MIELQNVGFAYNNKHTVFSNLNLYIDRYCIYCRQ